MTYTVASIKPGGAEEEHSGLSLLGALHQCHILLCAGRERVCVEPFSGTRSLASDDGESWEGWNNGCVETGMTLSSALAWMQTQPL